VVGAAEVTDAEQAYLERVAEDCERLLGPGVEMGALELGIDDDIVLRLRYRLGGLAATSEGHGETVVAAHADLRQRLVLDRIGLAMRGILGQRR